MKLQPGMVGQLTGCLKGSEREFGVVFVIIFILVEFSGLGNPLSICMLRERARV